MEPVHRPGSLDPQQPGNPIGHRLLTLHNLRFVLDLVDGARSAIERGELNAYKVAALERLRAASEVSKCRAM